MHTVILLSYLQFGITSKGPQQRIHEPFGDVCLQLFIGDGEVWMLAIVTQDIPIK